MRPRDRKRKFKHPNNSQNEAPSVSFGQDDYSHQQANQEGNVDLRSVLNKRRTTPSMERSAEYPEKIYQFNGEILIYEEMFQCGLIQIYVENLPSVACFFQFNHIFGEISPAHGSPVQLCARMYNSDHQIPYIAAIIWAPGNTPNTSLVEMLMNNSISPQEEQGYFQCAETMFQCIQQQQIQLQQIQSQQQLNQQQEQLQQQQHQQQQQLQQQQQNFQFNSNAGASYPKRSCPDPMEFPNNESFIPDPSESFFSGFKNVENSFDAYDEGSSRSNERRQNRTKRRSGQSNDGRESRRQETRKDDVEETRSVRYVGDFNLASSNLVEEVRVAEAVVDKLFTKYVGTMSILTSSGKKTKPVLFHANQLLYDSKDGHVPFLESHTSEELSKELKEGTKVTLHARKISGCDYSLQATAIWKSDRVPAASDYKTSELLPDLGLKLNDFIFSKTGDVKFRSNPLIGAPDNMVQGEIKEYFSFEMGFIQLQTGETVLFHLDQVWSNGKNGDMIIFKTVQEDTLDQHLPLGTKVWVNYRSIAASQISALKYQATIVYKRDEDNSKDIIPKEYIDKFSPFETRVALVDELDDLFDRYKKVIKKNRGVSATNFTPVHAVLNGLPKDWKAEVVASLDDQFGIIKISSSSFRGLTYGVDMVYAMFHIEDVYDMDGVPAVRNAKITMKNLINSPVNLTARSICKEFDPEGIFDVQKKLLRDNKDYGAIPLLQAVVVCLKLSASSSTNTSYIPKPTALKDKPKSFGNLGCEHYLNPLLSAKLDIKLKDFLKIPRKLNLPYDRTLVSVIMSRNHEKTMLKDLSDVDINATDRFVYGTIPQIPEDNLDSLPRILTAHNVTLVYLFKKRFKTTAGLFKLDVEVDSRKTVTSYAYFDISKYKFFTTPDYFATDLVNIMKISSSDRFQIHAMLAYPGSVIPYLAVGVWNEDLRVEMREMTPMDVKFDGDYAKDLKWDVKELAKLCTVKKDNQKSSKSGHSDTRASDKSYSIRVPVPKHVGTVTGDVRYYDQNRVSILNNELQAVLNNCIAKVDQILTDHLAIVSFHQGTKQIKILCSSEDTFLLNITEKFHQFKDFKARNKLKFNKASEVWNLSAKYLKKSLFEVLKVGQQVVCNAVALISNPDTNNANISYISSGVVVPTTAQTAVSVPLSSIVSSSKVSDDFKMYFMKIIRSVDINGEFEKGSFTIYHPKKLPDNYLEGKNLRPEYVTENVWISRGLPTPVSVKKPPPKPIVWEPIISNIYGQVLKIVDKNYGIGVSYMPLFEDSDECEPFQFLFDIFDIYIGDNDCNELGKKLPDVLSSGDFLKMNVVKVEIPVGGHRNIQYMATAMVVDKNIDGVKVKEIPDAAPVISDIEQVTQNKLDNFKVVAGVINQSKPSQNEEAIIKTVKTGELMRSFTGKSRTENAIPRREESPIAIDNEESDEEITVIETVEQVSEGDDGIHDHGLKNKDLRNLITCYNAFVKGNSMKKTKEKYSLKAIKKASNVDKDLDFFQDFLLKIGEKCLKIKKGFKVGHMFLTNSQVNWILSHGILSKDDICYNKNNHEADGADVEEDDILKNIQFNKLRKFIIDFHNHMCNRLSVEEMNKNAGMNMGQCRKVMLAISKACRNAPSKNQGIKIHNIYVSPGWVEKLKSYK